MGIDTLLDAGDWSTAQSRECMNYSIVKLASNERRDDDSDDGPCAHREFKLGIECAAKKGHFFSRRGVEQAF